MKRFEIYRCPKNCDIYTKIDRHKLIGNTVASSMDEAIFKIYKNIKFDLSFLEREHFSEEELSFMDYGKTYKGCKYKYYIIGLFQPNNELAPKNICREYGITEVKI